MRALAAALSRRGVASVIKPVPADGAPVGGDVVIVDSYQTRADDGALYVASTVVAVDDLERNLRVDLVIDPNPGGTVPAPRARRTLSGPSFALITPLLEQPHPCGARTQTVLVCTGGGDSGAAGIAIATDVASLLPTADVRVVVGPWARPPARGNITILQDLPSLELELLASDVVVTAGGVTMLESLHAGRPTVVVVTADNQRRAVAGAIAAGAAVTAEPSDAAKAAADLFGDQERREALTRAAAAYVDGLGADRVAEAVLELT